MYMTRVLLSLEIIVELGEYCRSCCKFIIRCKSYICNDEMRMFAELF